MKKVRRHTGENALRLVGIIDATGDTELDLDAIAELHQRHGVLALDSDKDNIRDRLMAGAQLLVMARDNATTDATVKLARRWRAYSSVSDAVKEANSHSIGGGHSSSSVGRAAARHNWEGTGPMRRGGRSTIQVGDRQNVLAKVSKNS